MSYDYVDQLDKFTLQKLGIKKVIQVDNRMARLLFQNRGLEKFIKELQTVICFTNYMAV